MGHENSLRTGTCFGPDAQEHAASGHAEFRGVIHTVQDAERCSVAPIQALEQSERSPILPFVNYNAAKLALVGSCSVPRPPKERGQDGKGKV